MFNTKLDEKRLVKDDIRAYYESGFKSVDDLKIGLEYERLPIFLKTGANADYYSEFGICNLLRKFAKADNWDFITDDFNIIGLRKEFQTITLEPGCQFEYSLTPQKNIKDLKKEIELNDKALNKHLKEYGISLLNYGVSPLVTYKSIHLIPKHRYKIMAKYLWGILSDVMMRETAGIQCCVDFVDEVDMARKFILANKLVPFVCAMFANSPIRGGVETGYKSFRALSWLNTDNDRCGFAMNLDDGFSIEQYIDKVLKTPIIFLNKNELPLELNGRINFGQYLTNGYEGFEPTMADYKLQANLYFPEVRLNKFIEIRNHDCVRKDLLMSLIALYKGILYDTVAMDEVEDLLQPFKHLDYSELRYEVPRFALHCRIGSKKVSDIANEILMIAEKSLKRQGLGEDRYIGAIRAYTKRGLTPADEVLKNWNGCWHKDINKMISWLIKQSA